MFKIVKNPKAWWPVTFPGVTEDGQVVENKIEVRFVLHDEDENIQLARDMGAASEEAADDVLPSAFAADIVMRIAEDWKGVTLDDGSVDGMSLPFTRENVAMLVRVPNAFDGITAGYRACRAGRAGARQGN